VNGRVFCVIPFKISASLEVRPGVHRDDAADVADAKRLLTCLVGTDRLRFDRAAIYVARLVWLLTAGSRTHTVRLAQQILKWCAGLLCCVSTLFVMVLEAKTFSFSAELTPILVPEA